MIQFTGLDQAPWLELKVLLDTCFPNPPLDVFERVILATHQRPKLWIARQDLSIHGLVMLAPHSKGGHLENLAVSPAARGRGIGQALVRQLLQDSAENGPILISLTTRIPQFFISLGFKEVGNLADGSVAMVQCLP
jgi:N-acetylglutamate synthase-like GNAT family acetyltransferase